MVLESGRAELIFASLNILVAFKSASKSKRPFTTSTFALRFLAMAPCNHFNSRSPSVFSSSRYLQRAYDGLRHSPLKTITRKGNEMKLNFRVGEGLAGFFRQNFSLAHEISLFYQAADYIQIMFDEKNCLVDSGKHDYIAILALIGRMMRRNFWILRQTSSSYFF